MIATMFISPAQKKVPISNISPFFVIAFCLRKKTCIFKPSSRLGTFPTFLCTNWIKIYTFWTFRFTFSNILDFPGGSDGKESACNVGDPGSIPGSGRCPGERNGYPLQYSCLKNSMDRGAWWRSPWGHIKSDTTGQLILSLFQIWWLWFLWV